jgi:hypothetical protein
MRAGDEAAGVEGRSDVYTAVTEAIGLKRRVCVYACVLFMWVHESPPYVVVA